MSSTTPTPSSSSAVEPFDPAQHPHRRWNPLNRSYVLCSPHRTQRPWQGAQESAQSIDLPEYDPECYLCPRNTRATGGTNPDYQSTFHFDNDYAALKPQEVEPEKQVHPLLRSQPARGRCYVLCFHPHHNLTIARLSSPPYSARSHLLPIVEAWTSLYRSIPTRDPFVRYVQIFENKGSAMGCSNPHPHGQVWSLDYVPDEPLRELESMRDYALDAAHRRGAATGDDDAAAPPPPLDDAGRPSLLLSYASLERHLPDRPRVVVEGVHFVAVVPYWGVWPFELLVLPYRRQLRSLAHMTPDERADLADVVGETTCRLDNLFRCSFPYSMGIHQQPVVVPSGAAAAAAAGAEDSDHARDGQGGGLDNFAQFHVHFYPPLLRSATVRKFLVGFEMMAEPQRDLTAEQAAARIRACSTTHYLAEAHK